MSTFPPRECGIATFTQDLCHAMDQKFNPKVKSKIVAMDSNASGSLKYNEDVILNINDSNVQDYIDAAEKINGMEDVKVVSIQHEYGIFGGYYGEYLIKFVEILNKPIFVTFHTIVPDNISTSATRKRVLQVLAKKATQIIVLNKMAIDILKTDYNIDNSKIVVIPHGIHQVPFESSSHEKIKFGYENRLVLSTFGFLSRHKGYEHIIDSLPGVIEKFPQVLYLIIGGIHPSKFIKEGDSYLRELKDKVQALGLQKHVIFIDRYVPLDELFRYLKATDLYLCHTNSEGQIVSGTLAYAMGCGRAVISTPFLHAKEIVTSDCGIIVDEFKRPTLFAKAIITLLSDPELLGKMGKNAYENTRPMVWSNVAELYMDFFKNSIGETTNIVPSSSSIPLQHL
tara:strand:+ start:347 stop:1537 length:1191 start_codon:yes stop_codon:yes gene_type:complete